jgi:branched-chain amino acid transport system ATP-binding protein
MIGAAKAQTALKDPVPALELAGLHFDKGGAEVIGGVDLKIAAGERHAVIGPPGSGKTTLANLISGLLSPTFGVVLLKGQNITGLPPHQISRAGLARSIQARSIQAGSMEVGSIQLAGAVRPAISAGFPNLTVDDNLRCSCLWSTGGGYTFWRSLTGLPVLNARTEELLELTGLTGHRYALPAALSTAQQLALNVGMAVAGGADVIVLDEPTANLSPDDAEPMVALLRKVTSGRTLLIMASKLDAVSTIAERVSVLVAGQIVVTDVPHRIKGNRDVQVAWRDMV